MAQQQKEGLAALQRALIVAEQLYQAAIDADQADWVAQMRTFIAQLEQQVSDLEGELQRLLAPLNSSDTAYRPMLSPLLGDQRAKDLIDEADSFEVRQRIGLLHRALRYGRDSIQASKAYQRLGMCYEELGNTTRAINYYTKTIELDDALGIVPIPALYWRGQLLAQRGDRESAQRDFERALPLDVPSFFPEEREVAEQYLAEPI